MSMEWLALLAVIMLGLITAVVVPTQLKLWRLLGKTEALVALLFAPCSGRDARRRIQTFAERTGKRVRKAAEQGSRIAREALEQGQEALEDTFSSKNRRHG